MACVFVPAVTVLLSANEVKESLDCMWSPQTGYLYTHPRGVGAEISGNIINIFFFRLKKKKKKNFQCEFSTALLYGYQKKTVRQAEVITK